MRPIICNAVAGICLLILLISCKNDDATTSVKDDNDQGLVLKKVTNEFSRTESNYTENGWLSYIIRNNENSVFKVFERVYKNNKLANELEFNAANNLMNKVDYYYDTDDKLISIVKKDMRAPIEFKNDSIVTTFSYQENKVFGNTFLSGAETTQMTFEFETAAYKKIKRFESFEGQSRNKVFEETYDYAENGNIISTTILIGRPEEIATRTFTYDDKTNPFYTGTIPHYLTLVLKTRARTSMALDLLIFSKNNMIKNSPSGLTSKYTYNEEGYPLTLELFDNNNVSLNKKTFEYYPL